MNKTMHFWHHRTYDGARRSFYRWCAKQGLIGKLFWNDHLNRWDRRGGGCYSNPYKHGYPIFNTRNTAMDYWLCQSREKRNERRAVKYIQKEDRWISFYQKEVAPYSTDLTREWVIKHFIYGTNLSYREVIDNVPDEVIEIQALLLVAEQIKQKRKQQYK